MMDRFTADILFIVIVLIIAAVLGFLIGYLLKKNKSNEEKKPLDTGSDKFESEIDRLSNYIKELEEKNKSSHNNIQELEKQRNELKSNLSDCEEKNLELSKQIQNNLEIQESKIKLKFDAQAAKEIYGKNIKADDLKIIEGIGPKIESIFKNNEIDSWYKLAKQDAENLMRILLKDGGDSYRIHNPKTWPQQALLAFEGKWEKLKLLQDDLIGGKG